MTLFPADLRAIEQSQLSIRIPAAAANPAVLIERASRDEITISFRRMLHGRDRLPQFVRHALIGIETEDPIVFRLLDRKLFLRAKAGPGVYDYSCAAAGGDVPCRVGGVRIDDYDLVGPGNGFAGGPDIRFFIERDDGG